MLSICIPAYNCNVDSLVTSLLKQTETCPYEIEYIVYDDGSDISIMSSSISGVKLVRFDLNLGRSCARNRLAQIAQGPFLLFLDAGTKIMNPKFIQQWMDIISENQPKVAYGGSYYQENEPDRNLSLRWKISTKRESRIFNERQKKPRSFKTNNVLIHKKVFDSIQFNEQLKGYGHEDTLFGFELKMQKIEILQVNNPVLNQGLDSNDQFLHKTEDAINNLRLCTSLASNKHLWLKEVRILRFYTCMCKIKTQFVLNILDKLFFKYIKKRCLKADAFWPVLYFDLYKLMVLHRNWRD